MKHRPAKRSAGAMPVAGLATELGAARRGRYTIPTRRGSGEALSLEAAYELGRDLERERVSAGWRPVGWKLGFTNQALWGQLGLDSPIRALTASSGRDNASRSAA